MHVQQFKTLYMYHSIEHITVTITVDPVFVQEYPDLIELLNSGLLHAPPPHSNLLRADLKQGTRSQLLDGSTSITCSQTPHGCVQAIQPLLIQA